MKRLGIACAVLTLSGPVQAAPLTKDDTNFMTSEIGALTVSSSCPDYAIVPNVGATMAQQMGVGRDIQQATIGAFLGYSPEIAEVTDWVKAVKAKLEQRRQANTLCDLGPMFVKYGWLTRKKG